MKAPSPAAGLAWGWRESNEACGLTRFERAEFRHFDQQGEGSGATRARLPPSTSAWTKASKPSPRDPLPSPLPISSSTCVMGARGWRGHEPGGADCYRDRLGRTPPSPRARSGASSARVAISSSTTASGLPSTARSARRLLGLRSRSNGAVRIAAARNRSFVPKRRRADPSAPTRIDFRKAAWRARPARPCGLALTVAADVGRRRPWSSRHSPRARRSKCAPIGLPSIIHADQRYQSNRDWSTPYRDRRRTGSDLRREGAPLK
jgi:hypothetical protein